MLFLSYSLYFLNKDLLKEVNSTRKKTPQLLNSAKFPANVGQITQNTLWRHFNLKWTLICHLNSIHLMSISWVFAHNRVESPCCFISRSSLKFFFLREILIDYRLVISLKKLLFVLVLWFFWRANVTLKARGGNCSTVNCQRVVVFTYVTL